MYRQPPDVMEQKKRGRPGMRDETGDTPFQMPTLSALESSPASATPTVVDMRVIPVAGHDSMLLNLSGAHGPFFTRNVIILTDSAGRSGIGEVPGGDAIRRTLDESKPLVLGQPI